MMSANVLRFAHFSDMHLTSRRYSWRTEDWFNKRLAAWLNLTVAGRGYRFRHAPQTTAAMVRDLRQRRADYLLFSGDATAMGFDDELEVLTSLLPLDEWPGIAVPGNHDYCTKTAQREEIFERRFARWQQGQRIDAERYPFAVRAGDVWLIGVNSAVGNRWPWDATGRVGASQLQRLRVLLAGLTGEGPRLLITHYPVVRASGRPEPFLRKMHDLDAVIEVCAAGRVSAWLHGHIHTAFHFPKGVHAPFPIVCAGSATQTRRWSYGEYEIRDGLLRAGVREYDPAGDLFRETRAFELELA
ncbi:MAG: metallophosphoesterase [Planctomycetia bacterium]|nr:metallophosphoesterase [Planctomycetia bacterium]